jgi:hypothetical protein
MKKLVLTAIALTSALSGFAQGTVVFNNRVAGTLLTHIYAPLAGAPTTKQTGNGSSDTPAGATSWAGYALLGAGGTAEAGHYMAVLLSAPGANANASSLLPSVPSSTFRTGTAAGGIAPQTATLGNVLPDAAVATLALVAWDNTSGLYSTWAQASVAWNQGLIAAGMSPLWNQDLIGGVINGAPNMINSTDGANNHLSSFNIYTIPEPTSFALAGLGAAALMIFRRRK